MMDCPPLSESPSPGSNPTNWVWLLTVCCYCGTHTLTHTQQPTQQPHSHTTHSLAHTSDCYCERFFEQRGVAALAFHFIDKPTESLPSFQSMYPWCLNSNIPSSLCSLRDNGKLHAVRRSAKSTVCVCVSACVCVC